jgi:hypothetical protein
MSKKYNPAALLFAEVGALKRYFPSGEFAKRTSVSFEWEVSFQPTPLSKQYRIKLTYKVNDIPKVYVIEPEKLELFPEKDKLPHVYSTAKQKLCLYFPKAHEWKPGMMVAKTIVPWASEWLQYYELWLATGNWLGGGVHIDEDGKSVIT